MLYLLIANAIAFWLLFGIIQWNSKILQFFSLTFAVINTIAAYNVFQQVHGVVLAHVLK